MINAYFRFIKKERLLQSFCVNKRVQVAIFVVMHCEALPTLQAKDFRALGNKLIDILCEKNQWGPDSIRYLKFALDIGGEFELSNYDGFNLLPLEIQRLLTCKFNSTLDYWERQWFKYF